VAFPTAAAFASLLYILAFFEMILLRMKYLIDRKSIISKDRCLRKRFKLKKHYFQKEMGFNLSRFPKFTNLCILQNKKAFKYLNLSHIVTSCKEYKYEIYRFTFKAKCTSNSLSLFLSLTHTHTHREG